MLEKSLAAIKDDTEEAPWMVMGTPQFEAVYLFYDALCGELDTRLQAPFVAAMLPIRYRLRPGGRVEQLAPDVMVANVRVHPRDSYVLEDEGVAPSFALEVISAESRARDLNFKPERYAAIGIREYAVFAPRAADGRVLMDPPLRGFRLGPADEKYVEWEPDHQGRLYSESLGVWLAVREGALRVLRLDGSIVPTPAEERAAAHLRGKLEQQPQQ